MSACIEPSTRNDAAVEDDDTTSVVVGTIKNPTVPSDEYYSNDYIQTTLTHNYISRRAMIDNSKHVEMKGRSIIYPDVHIRNNMKHHHCTIIRIGRYCHIQSNTVIYQHPPPRRVQPRGMDDDDDENDNDDHDDDDLDTTTTAITTNTTTNTSRRRISMTIGSHTMIGSHCRIAITAAIGSNCSIGDYVTIGHHVSIKDNCRIAPHTEIPAHTNIPPFTRCFHPPVTQIRTLPVVNNTTSRRIDAADTPVEWNGTARRQIRLLTEPLPPAIAVELQECAEQAFHNFVTEFKMREQRKVGTK
jgi:carbonic anhydrase/acetyltransferase-like protein (isoleucine patch superfamily)